jgi:hypothetical protein
MMMYGMASVAGRRWMMFVDGENLTKRAQDLAAKVGVNMDNGSQFPHFKRDVYFWPANHKPWKIHPTAFRVAVSPQAERCYYYTAMQGDDADREAAHDALLSLGFSPLVLKKMKGRPPKGVDIALTKDMLVQAFFNNYELAILVTGDGDYVPVVEEVKRLGKRVIVAFLRNADGFSPDLRRVADECLELDLANPPN